MEFSRLVKNIDPHRRGVEQIAGGDGEVLRDQIEGVETNASVTGQDLGDPRRRLADLFRKFGLPNVVGLQLCREAFPESFGRGVGGHIVRKGLIRMGDLYHTRLL